MVLSALVAEPTEEERPAQTPDTYGMPVVVEPDVKSPQPSLQSGCMPSSAAAWVSTAPNEPTATPPLHRYSNVQKPKSNPHCDYMVTVSGISEPSERESHVPRTHIGCTWSVILEPDLKSLISCSRPDSKLLEPALKSVVPSPRHLSSGTHHVRSPRHKMPSPGQKVPSPRHKIPSPQPQVSSPQPKAPSFPHKGPNPLHISALPTTKFLVPTPPIEPRGSSVPPILRPSTRQKAKSKPLSAAKGTTQCEVSEAPEVACSSPDDGNTYGFHNQLPEIQQVRPGLFIGTQRAAASKQLLAAAKITHIVSMNGSPPLWPSEYHYHTEHMMDDDPYSLLKNMVKICSFMRQAVLDGCNVLVHSSRGANRSGSMVIGFLMLQENLSYVKVSRFFSALMFSHFLPHQFVQTTPGVPSVHFGTVDFSVSSAFAQRGRG